MARLAIVWSAAAVLGVSQAFAADPVAPPPSGPEVEEKSAPLVIPDEPVPGSLRAWPGDMPAEMQRLHEQMQALRMQGGPLDAEQVRQLQQQLAQQAGAMAAAPGGRMLGGPAAIVRAAEVRREKAAFLGVTTSAVTATLREQLKIDKGVGLVVDFVEKDSPADAAGIKVHDIITKLDDQVLINGQQLAVLVRTKKDGDSITLTVLHEGKTTTATAKLVEKDLPVLEEGNPWAVPDRKVFVVPAVPGDRAGGPVPEGVTVRKSERMTMKANADGSSVRTFSDGEETLTVTTGADGKMALVAKDKEGKELFNGPINTEEEKKAVPGDVAERLKKMSGKAEGGNLRAEAEARIGATPGGVRVELNDGTGTQTLDAQSITLARADEAHVLTLSIKGSGEKLSRTLVVKDATTGKVIFDVPVDTAEQRKGLPAELAKKLEGLELKAGK